MFLIVAALPACTIRLVSSYDEETDRSVMALQRKIETFLVKLEELEGASDCGYDHHKPFYAASKVEGEEATLLDPLDGKKAISLQRLAEKWKGSGILLWKKIEGVTLPFSSDGTLQVKEGSDPAVKKIQELLKKEGLFAGDADGFWGPQTSRALLFFQQKEGLEEEGLWGIETEILLSQRSQKSGPALRSKTSG